KNHGAGAHALSRTQFLPWLRTGFIPEYIVQNAASCRMAAKALFPVGKCLLALRRLGRHLLPDCGQAQPAHGRYVGLLRLAAVRTAAQLDSFPSAFEDQF